MPPPTAPCATRSRPGGSAGRCSRARLPRRLPAAAPAGLADHRARGRRRRDPRHHRPRCRHAALRARRRAGRGRGDEPERPAWRRAGSRTARWRVLRFRSGLLAQLHDAFTTPFARHRLRGARHRGLAVRAGRDDPAAVGEVVLRTAAGEEALPVAHGEPLRARGAPVPRRDARRGPSRRPPARTASGRWRLASRCATRPRTAAGSSPSRVWEAEPMARATGLSAAEAAALIPDGAVVTVSSSSGLGCPDAVLAAIGERFAATGHPRNLTTLHPIAAGDMYGIKGIDHIAQAGPAREGAGRLLSERPVLGAVAGDLADDHRGPQSPPTTCRRGILFDMHREAAAKRPGVLTKVGLDTFVDPRPPGLRHERHGRGRADRPQGRVRRRRPGCSSRPSCPTSRSSAPPRPTSAATSPTSTRAPISAPLDQALAARNNGGIVIAQVKRLAEAGTLKPHDVHVPGRAGRRTSSSRPTRCRRRRPPTTRRSAARSFRAAGELPRCRRGASTR